MNNLVSVIIPVYNVRQYIREALDSVINQTYKNLEIIIVDDGSTDNSGRICDGYAKKDNRIKIIHQENMGLSRARNNGIELMSGDYVVFLDSDDAYNLNFIEKMLNAALNNNADVVVCKYALCFTTGKMRLIGTEITKPYIKTGLYSRREFLHLLADRKTDAHLCNRMYKRELWANIKFPDGHVYEDIETAYKITNLCKNIYVLEDILYLYRKGPDTVTSTESIDNIYDRLLAYSKVDTFMINHQDDFNDFLINKHRRLISTIISEYGDKLKDKKYSFALNVIERNKKIRP